MREKNIIDDNVLRSVEEANASELEINREYIVNRHLKNVGIEIKEVSSVLLGEMWRTLTHGEFPQELWELNRPLIEKFKQKYQTCE